jgi:hypothetical protein
MATKPYELGSADKKQPAVIQSLKSGATAPFEAKEINQLQASEAQKKGEWRLAVWCEDMELARKRAKDLNARACIGPRTLPELPKKEEPGAPVQQMVDWKPEKPGMPKKAKEVKGALKAGDMFQEISGDEPYKVVDLVSGGESFFTDKKDAYKMAFIIKTRLGHNYRIEFRDPGSPDSPAELLRLPMSDDVKDIRAAVEDPTAAPRGVKRATAAMSAWMSAGGSNIAGSEDAQTNLVDLFTDLLHYADKHGLDGALAMSRAEGHHAAETDGEEVVIEGSQGSRNFEKCAECGKNVGQADITMAGMPGDQFCSEACVNRAYNKLRPIHKRKVKQAGDKHIMAGAKVNAAKDEDWDTEEVSRWIANDEDLYRVARRAHNARTMEEQLKPLMEKNKYIRVDWDAVNWEDVYADMDNADTDAKVNAAKTARGKRRVVAMRAGFGEHRAHQRHQGPREG